MLAPKSIDLQEDEERLGLALQSWVILFDLPFMQHPATDHLHIKVAHAECPLAGFTQQEIEHGHRPIAISPDYGKRGDHHS